MTNALYEVTTNYIAGRSTLATTTSPPKRFRAIRRIYFDTVARTGHAKQSSRSAILRCGLRVKEERDVVMKTISDFRTMRRSAMRAADNPIDLAGESTR
jgi:hypothetical protein